MRALLAAALLVLTAPAGAATLYVGPSGSDADDCSQASPCREIRRALQRVREGAGMTVSVADGEYLGFTVSGISGSQAEPLVIRAEGTGARILPTTDRAWWENRDNILLMQAHHTVIDGLRTFNAPRAGLRVDNSHHVTIRNGIFGDNGTWGIFTNHSNDTVIEYNETYGSGREHGIYVSNSGDRPVIRGNRSHDNRANGIHMNGDLSAGGADGVAADGIISGALLEDNVIYGNGTGGGSGINMDGVHDSIVRNNLLYDNHASGIAMFRQNGAQGPKGNLVANNTIDMASDARYAILVGQSAGANTLRNNVLYNRNPNRGALDFKSEADITSTDSDYNVFGDVAPYVTPDDWSTRLTLAQWQARGKDLHTAVASAGVLFADPAARDYRLVSGAPAIDAGRTLAQVPRDIAGTARPQGTGYDLGAYEFAGGGAANQPPSVAAGPDLSVTLPALARLEGTASDDGLPDPPGALTLAWSKVSGPGVVRFANPDRLSTAAQFSEAGSYVLRLTGGDGERSAYDDVTVTVSAPAAPYLWCRAPPPPDPAGRVIRVATEPQLQAAVAGLQSGDTILVAPGTYQLSKTIRLTGGVTGVALRGATGSRGDVILKGPGMSNRSYGATPHGVWVGNARGVVVADLTIRDIYFHPIQMDPNFGPVTDPWIHNVRLVNAGEQFIKVSPGAGSLAGISGGKVECSAMEYDTTARSDYTNGVDVHEGHGWAIRDSLFRNIRAPAGGGLAGPAILMWNDSRDTIAERNVFLNCQRGIAFGLIQRSGFRDHQRGIIRNNVFHRSASQSGDVAIYVADSPGTKVLHNTSLLSGTYPNAIEYRFATTAGVDIRYNLSDAAVVARTGAAGTVAGNVVNAQAAWFQGASSGDLHLVADATEAIDGAAAHPDAPEDLDGQARPIGSAPDAGADEFGSGGAPPPPPSCSFRFTAQPARTIVSEGGTAVFSVKTQPAAASYQWRMKGADIPGATGESYTIAAALPSDDGARLSVAAVDACGASHASDEAVLRVIADLVVRVLPDEWRTIVFDVGNGTVTLRIPPGAFPAALDIRLRRPEGLKTLGASPLAELKSTGIGVEVNTGGRQPLRAIEMAFSQMEGVDGGEPLVVARYQPGSGWVPLSSRPDGGAVKGFTDHFSLFQVMAAVPAASVESVRVFPNPLRPFAGHARMNFVNLPANARVRIYSLVGERIREISADGAGMASWDGTNAYGRAVASGVYFALAEAGGDRKTFKVAVQR